MSVARASNIRAGVKALVAAADTDAVVYDYKRFSADLGRFLDLYKVTVGGREVIRGWEVWLTGLQIQQGRDTHRFDNVYGVQIRGYFGVDDASASDKLAFDEAENMVIYLRKYRQLNGVLETGLYAHGTASEERGTWPSVDVFEERLFSDMLVHYIEINFDVHETETVIYLE